MDWQFHNTVYIRNVEKMHDFVHFQNHILTSNIRQKYNNSYIQSILTNFYKVSLGEIL